MSKNNECAEFEEFKNEMERLMENIEKDAIKFYNKDNDTAGVRLRKGLKAIRVYVKDVSDSTSPKNNI